MNDDVYYQKDFNLLPRGILRAVIARVDGAPSRADIAKAAIRDRIDIIKWNRKSTDTQFEAFAKNPRLWKVKE